MRGVAGYGRYDDDPQRVGCPRARSDMTPCLARDGRVALRDGRRCVGCDEYPRVLVADLAAAANVAVAAGSRTYLEYADLLAGMVRALTEPGGPVSYQAGTGPPG